MYIFKYFTKLRSYCSNSSSLEGTGCYYSSISLNSFPLEITNLLVSLLLLFFRGCGCGGQSAFGTSPVFACQGCRSWTPLVS